MGKNSKKRQNKLRKVGGAGGVLNGLVTHGTEKQVATEVPVMPCNRPPEYRPLLVSEADTVFLRDLLTAVDPHYPLLADLGELLGRFRDTASHVAELVKVARANGFWEEEKTANDALKRVGRGAAERRAEAQRQLAELAPTVDEVKEHVKKIKKGDR